jgi:hypothetical protein
VAEPPRASAEVLSQVEREMADPGHVAQNGGQSLEDGRASFMNFVRSHHDVDLRSARRQGSARLAPPLAGILGYLLALPGRASPRVGHSTSPERWRAAPTPGDRLYAVFTNDRCDNA